MQLTLTSNYSSPLSSPRTPTAGACPSFMVTTTSSKSLRERRGVTFKLSLSETDVPPKGHLEPRFSNLPRRQRLTPLRSSSLGGAGGGLKSGGEPREVKVPLRSATNLSPVKDLRSGRARDFGLTDGWTTLQK
jgi:hypothetical protein